MFSKYLPHRLMRIVSSFLQNYEISRIGIFALFFTCGLTLTLVISACSASNTGNSVATQTANKGVVVRIGYQKAATILSALKNRGNLAQTLTTAGASVTWAEFPAGPPMLEAMKPSRERFHQGRNEDYRTYGVEMHISEIGLCNPLLSLSGVSK